MMKYLPYLLLGIIFYSCTVKTPQVGYRIFASIDSLPEGPVILKRYTNGNWNNIDTALAQAGTFVFEGKVDIPEMYRIVISDTLSYIPVFIDNNEITINGTLDSLKYVKITGSKIQEDYELFWGGLKSYSNSLDSIDKLYIEAREKRNKKRMAELDTLYEFISDKRAAAMKQYVQDNKSSVISAYITWTQLVHRSGLNELDSLTAQFDSTLNESVYIKMLKNYIAVLRRVEIGQPAVDFTMNDPDGKPISLASLNGNYLLIDFWASWCPPCRVENPNLVKAYKKYHKKGFDILGVSFDKNKTPWIRAIKDDKLDWTHVSDLKHWDNEAGKAYGIRSIPSNILLDPKGVIIAKNLRGEELQQKLEEIFK